MKFIYPAVFHEEKDGKYKGYFPDLECCYGEGDTIDDAIDDANEAARVWNLQKKIHSSRMYLTRKILT